MTAQQTHKLPTDADRLAQAVSPLSVTDTERLNALFTLFGGHYAFPAVWEMSELFKDGRRGLDAFLLKNPSLLGR